MEKDYFDILTVFEGDEETPILDFLLEESEKLNAEKKGELDAILKANPGNPEGYYTDILCTHGSLAFAVGYVFGQNFNICDKETKALVGELKCRLTKEGLLKYEPKYEPKVKAPAKEEDELGPWNVLDRGLENINQAKGIIKTVLRVVVAEDDDLCCTLSIAGDLLDDVEKGIDVAMDMVAGHYPKKNEKGQG